MSECLWRAGICLRGCQKGAAAAQRALLLIQSHVFTASGTHFHLKDGLIVLAARRVSALPGFEMLGKQKRFHGSAVAFVLTPSDPAVPFNPKRHKKLKRDGGLSRSERHVALPAMSRRLHFKSRCHQITSDHATSSVQKALRGFDGLWDGFYPPDNLKGNGQQLTANRRLINAV